MSERYIGVPWRSRFLRAPKIAFELLRRSDFAMLDSLASAKLGLKTGSDKFFYPVRFERRNQQQALERQHTTVHLRGLHGAWEGNLRVADLLPAVLNPHQLITPAGRTLVVPRRTQALYLYPQDGPLRADLSDYVKAGERAGVNKLKLVQGNASSKRWFKQARGIVRSRWALPYNSAYDYGAFDNAVGAVLNGRFVGVDPLDEVDPDLLGAALNTTFVIVSRLLEGTTTGVEGAFDVGPPAVSRMVIPDVRRIGSKQATEICNVLDEMRSENLIPGAPTASATVSELRNRLDLAVLTGLGCSRGEASAVIGRVYENYARWRASVETVETMMRANRREMSRQGRNRAARPVDVAARHIWEEIEHLATAYPSHLLSSEDATETVDLGRRVKIPAQEPLFEAGVVFAVDGDRVDLGSYDRTRYLGMLLTIGFEPPFEIPIDGTKAGAIVDAFDEDLAAFHHEVRTRAEAYLSEPHAIDAVINAVQRLWFRKGRSLGMTRR
jgi:hypothetical protein